MVFSIGIHKRLEARNKQGRQRAAVRHKDQNASCSSHPARLLSVWLAGCVCCCCCCCRFIQNMFAQMSLNGGRSFAFVWAPFSVPPKAKVCPPRTVIRHGDGQLASAHDPVGPQPVGRRPNVDLDRSELCFFFSLLKGPVFYQFWGRHQIQSSRNVDTNEPPSRPSTESGWSQLNSRRTRQDSRSTYWAHKLSPGQSAGLTLRRVGCVCVCLCSAAARPTPMRKRVQWVSQRVNGAHELA